ncbi:retron St85 family effector protein [Photobacterium carnosum]|uniref:Uncharacterized protein n=1 Tax=Photobacterium carnosum TaxID=2023717 RepID=A0A2N4ULT7_9GAMM|nr:retron St85 family effector protein [Photobacterium carnosum]PLC55975.1 hypothetical protein CIK00_20895 [Photobacterium carnosum]
MWFNHPKFVIAKKELIEQLSNSSAITNDSLEAKNARSNIFRKITLPKIAFICGGDPRYCKNREKIENYIINHADTVMTFRAEYAWETIMNTKKNVNALKLEEWLADFSDVVIILVESFGTVAELGAFSISPKLRRKLLPILDKKYQHDESFINTGPIKWVNDDSVYKPAIYADFNTILTSMPEVLGRIDKKRSKTYKSRNNSSTYGKYKFTSKELLFSVIIIITSIGPVDEDSILDICHEAFSIITNSEKEEIKFIITLCVALGIVKNSLIKDSNYYTCLNYKKLYSNEATKSLLEISQKIRSRCLSSLIYIDEFKDKIKEISENVN